MSQTLAPTEPTEQAWTLNSTHRCDTSGCGAQAYVQVILNDQDLLFCSHHYNKYEPKLSTLGAVVLDERERLYAVAKLDVSA